MRKLGETLFAINYVIIDEQRNTLHIEAADDITALNQAELILALAEMYGELRGDEKLILYKYKSGLGYRTLLATYNLWTD